ncbi:hypothetical protein BOTBODRAFT_148497 [Botryobasidium botryosum FD-172 SS1]|uniref:Vacuolar membrane protein n=1 Tax=Botryobasidium botryosum (strain FD-172 SS1) TaxID=930990 RepID=A0A067M2G3_BOTB1|nr:hypothetical protein BOTBODRAFT_148497 [Botryobasidium botryosum FD-172 SS1]
MSTPISSDDPPLIPIPDVDDQCRLLGPTALVVQALMGIFVIASLLYKRQHEKPRRPWRIWTFDVSKQVVGQIMVHLLNVFISDLVAGHTATNPCVAYFINILIDTTLGVGIIFYFLKVANHILTVRLKLDGFTSGLYGEPPSYKFWLRQAAVYVCALLAMKITVVVMFAVFPWLYDVGEWLISWTGDKGGVQVIFVMGLFPIAMNVLQFWLIDSIVKMKDTLSLSPVSSPLEPDQEPLVFDIEAQDNSDDERDGDLEARPHLRSASSSFDFGSQRSISPEPHTPTTFTAPEPKIPPTTKSESALRHGVRRSPPPSPSPTPSYGAVESGNDHGHDQWDAWKSSPEDRNRDNTGERRPSADVVPHAESWKMPVLSPAIATSKQLS